MSSTDSTQQTQAPAAPWARSIDRLKSYVGQRGGRRAVSIIPATSIAGRALVMVVAIMTLLASITAGSVTILVGAADQWSSEIAREATIQVKPMTGRDLEADLVDIAAMARRAEGIADARINSRDQATALLAPWFGDGANLADLPVPRLIVLSLTGSSPPDFDRLRGEIAAKYPNAILNDHSPWVNRLTAMARAMVLAGLTILVLVLVATALAVVFATRAAMAENREIIGVLDLVGAEDRFIAGAFQQHFLRLGLQGGAIGGALAILAFFLINAFGFLGGESMDALTGSLALGWTGYLTIALIVIVVAGMTAYISRRTVYKQVHGN
jgi:cell division transport system permease protein